MLTIQLHFQSTPLVYLNNRLSCCQCALQRGDGGREKVLSAAWDDKLRGRHICPRIGRVGSRQRPNGTSASLPDDGIKPWNDAGSLEWREVRIVGPTVLEKLESINDAARIARKE